MPDVAQPPALTVRNALVAASARLGGLPDGSPRLEAELLLGAATGLDRARLLSWPDAPISSDTQRHLATLVERRARGEPVAYILGSQGFWTLDLEVSPDTLIPRPETELLVELALGNLPPTAGLIVADLGTGSGAIAAALASERPAWALVASDRSLGALAIAAANSRRLRLSNLFALAADWLATFAPGTLDAILSNPPYVPVGDPHLNRGDLRYEPHTALAAGFDGLAAIRTILDQAPGRLKPGGLLAVEHGFDQGEAVRALFGLAGLTRIETHRDLGGHERVTLAWRAADDDASSCICP
jgi:release factor glutamine methyltransferase